MPTQVVRAPAGDTVANLHDAARLLHRHDPFVRDAFGKAFVPMMPAGVADAIRVLAEFQVLGVRALEQPEQPFGIHLVLLDAIDRERVVRGRRTKVIPGRRVGGIDEASGNRR